MTHLDKSLPVPDRVEDLLKQMTIEEKVAQLCCILPTQLMGAVIPDPQLLSKFMKHGLGRVTQFGSISWESPLESTKLANGIQAWVIENTRLKIPVLFQIEASNGLLAVDATIFPSPINLANTWNPVLVQEAATIIREQMLAIGARKALAPVFDLAQDPRWGRVDETYGEDPYLSASIGCAYVQGIQTDDLTHGAAACGKHFIGYSKSQGGLNKTDVSMSDRDLYEYFAYPFEAAIRKFDLKSIMCTYSAINGVPASINKPIMRDFLRGKLGFDGNLLCDGGSIEMVITDFHAAESLLDAAVKSLEAGLEANTPVSDAYKYLPEALEKGKIDIRLIDDAVRSTLKLKFELGLFDNPFVQENSVELAYEGKKTQNQALAEKLACESLILLKNEGDLLPYKQENSTIALIGPHIDRLLACFPGFSTPASLDLYKGMFSELSEESQKDVRRKTSMSGVSAAEEKIMEEQLEEEAKGFANFYDSYAAMAERLGNISTEGFISDHYGVPTLEEAFKRFAPAGSSFVSAHGCNINDDDRTGFDEAVQAAQKSDVVFLCLGDRSDWVEGTAGECHDSTTLNLPGVQHDLIKAIYAAGKPVVLVIFEARPHSINWENEHIPAILDVWYPGERGSIAIAKTLFGLSNPSGKLTVTVPRSVGQVPIYYNHRTGSGYHDPITDQEIERTGLFHGYYNESTTPLFHFGHGLSYSKFDYSDLKIEPANVSTEKTVNIACKLTNIGNYDGQETVQLYTFDREAHTVRPVKVLTGFHKISLKKGESCRINFEVDVCQLASLDMDMNLTVEPGNFDVMIGSSSSDIRLKGSFSVTGETKHLPNRQIFFSKSSQNI